MRFPLRFTSDFQLGVIARGMKARGQAPLVLRLPPYTENSLAACPDVESAPRMVWIGGAEPLEYPEIARFANVLAGSGREVFLQTNGLLVRRRIHEFQPSPRFRFVFRFDATTTVENRMAMEAIRGAKLSGFVVCALSVVDEDTDLEELEKVHAGLHRLDLDGYLVVSRSAKEGARPVLMAARHRLLNRRWRRLSGMFDLVASSAEPDSRSPKRAARTAMPMPRLRTEATGDCEEGAQA
jgi:hypothetical protein